MKTLIVVDTQYDFLPVSKEEYKNNQGGALAVPNGDKIIPIINKLLPKYKMVIFTKDWHPRNMDAFASTHKGKNPFDTYINKDDVEDVLWPDHCVANTRGAELHDDIDFNLINGEFYIFKKGLTKDQHPYSGFGAEGLYDFLIEKDVTEIHVAGLALDYCVLDTILDSVKYKFNTTLILDGTRTITEDGYTNAIKKIVEKEVIITYSELI